MLCSRQTIETLKNWKIKLKAIFSGFNQILTWNLESKGTLKYRTVLELLNQNGFQHFLTSNKLNQNLNFPNLPNYNIETGHPEEKTERRKKTYWITGKNILKTWCHYSPFLFAVILPACGWKCLKLFRVVSERLLLSLRGVKTLVVPKTVTFSTVQWIRHEIRDVIYNRDWLNGIFVRTQFANRIFFVRDERQMHFLGNVFKDVSWDICYETSRKMSN